MPLFYPICFTTIIISLYTALASKIWIHIWLALEINMLAFIPFMYSNHSKSSIAMMKYFFIQALASMTFLLSILLHNLHYMNIIPPIITISMFTKLGLFPLFFWLPQISSSVNWYTLFILLTVQKIIPLNVLTLNLSCTMFSVLLLASCLMSVMGLWSQTSLKKLLAYSSMNHLTWMLAPLVIQKLIWPLYITLYSLITLMMIVFLSTHNFSSFSQLNPKINIFNCSHLLLMLWSLGGIPPLLGFFPKWLTISSLMLSYNLLLTILIISSLLSMVIYSALCYPLLLSTHLFKILPSNYNNFLVLTNILGLLPFIPIILC